MAPCLLSFALSVLLCIMTPSIGMENTAETCLVGHFLKNGKCHPCPPGTYQDMVNSTSKTCKNCPYDTFTPFTGVTSVHLCIKCPKTHFAKQGSAKCTKCPPGKIGRCGVCKTCKAGTYTKGDRCKCTKCPAGNISTKPNLDYCDGNCDDGFTSNSENTKCIRRKCPDGKIWMFFGCYKCGPTEFITGNMTKCKDCPWGTVPNLESGPSTKCIRCQPGYFMTNLLPQTYNGTPPVCRKCEKGTVTNGYSKPICRKPGTPCPINTFEDQDGDCSICDHNHRVDVVKKRCVRCPPNEVAMRGVLTSCKSCPTGQTPSPYGACDPPPCDPKGKGEESSYCRCPAGKHLYRSSCLPCSKDFFSESGAVKCTACPKGQTTEGIGASNCIPKPKCKKGYIRGSLVNVEFRSEVCISGSTGCPMGSNLVFRGKKMHCAKADGSINCRSGRIFNGKNKCIQCPPGGVLRRRRGELECVSCAKGYTSASDLSQNCYKCPKGFTSDGGWCECGFGRYVTDKGHCLPCNNNSVSRSVNSTECTVCENGYQPSPVATFCECRLPRLVNGAGLCVEG